MDDEKIHWLAFSAFKGIGPKRFALLRDYFGTAKKAWEAGEKELLAIGLGSRLTAELVEFRQKFNPSSSFLRLREKEIDCYFLDDNRYPESLKKIDNPPFVLYVNGSITPQDDLAIAVVGTRRMTGYGGQVTESLVTELVGAGLTIVSGLARGIDSMAHRTALKAGGRTIGVLASGLDIIYPPENASLVKEIINGHGAVISEFPLGSQPMPGSFPARNRIISGLALGTVVVEAPERSGALITARLAGEQGREVFAIPGPVTSPNAAGPSHLIKMGAKLVFKVEDILEELGVKTEFEEKKPVKAENPEEEAVLGLIEKEAKNFDEIVRETGFDSGKVASIISLLEIKGKVRNLGNMLYSINQ
ncbi:MAG: DNA-processing protein DprA [Candidatus Marinimicrobia bacterium]|nr:DNA-processing protein DprA [Candidatus Neomarinimicrobiota bacterium]